MVLFGPGISCIKTQTLPNLRLPISSGDDDDGGHCDGNEDDEAAAVEIVLVRSEAKGEDETQHLLADQDRWRAKLGHRSPQVTLVLRTFNIFKCSYT